MATNHESEVTSYYVVYYSKDGVPCHGTGSPDKAVIRVHPNRNSLSSNHELIFKLPSQKDNLDTTRRMLVSSYYWGRKDAQQDIREALGITDDGEGGFERSE